jgi:hypothetical protein
MTVTARDLADQIRLPPEHSGVVIPPALLDVLETVRLSKGINQAQFAEVCKLSACSKAIVRILFEEHMNVDDCIEAAVRLGMFREYLPFAMDDPRCHFMKRIYESIARLTETAGLRVLRAASIADDKTRVVVVRPDHPKYRNEWFALWAGHEIVHAVTFYFIPFVEMNKHRYFAVANDVAVCFSSLRELLIHFTRTKAHVIHCPCFDNKS